MNHPSRPAAAEPIFARNTAAVNRAIANLLAFCSIAIVVMVSLSALGLFEFGTTYSWIVLVGGLFVSLMPQVLIRVLPAPVMKYYMMISVALFIGIIGANKEVGVYITYALVPILSCLYFEPEFVLKSSALSYVVMLVSLYAIAPDLNELSQVGLPRQHTFLPYAAGFTLEFAVVTAALYKLVRRANQLILDYHSVEQANDAKLRFLHRMSHDIRTPLNGIIGLLHIDETHFDDKELVRENHQKMEVAANHLLSLINDVLQMSKLEDGRSELTHELICLEDLTKEIVDIILNRAVEHGIQ